MINSTNLVDWIRPLRKALTTNANSSSFASKIPTVTEPVNDGVIEIAGRGDTVVSPKAMVVIPYGLGSDNDVFDMRIIGWRHIGNWSPSTYSLWVPTILTQVTCTVSAAVGIAGAPVIATERFADTITVSTQLKTTDTDSGGAASSGVVLVCSPGSDLIAHLIVPIEGVEKVEFTFDQTTGSPTTNALVTFI